MNLAIPFLFAVLLLFSSCGKNPGGHQAHGSAKLFSETAESEAAVGAFVRWLADTTGTDRHMLSRLDPEDLAYLRTYFDRPTIPQAEEIADRTDRCYAVAFKGPDTLLYAGGRFWLFVCTEGSFVTEVSVFTEPEPADQFEMIISGVELIRDIANSGRVMQVKRGQSVRLNREQYPDIRSVKHALEQRFTPAAADSIVGLLGMVEREGAVWMDRRDVHESRDWENATIAGYERHARGFRASFRVPLSDGGKNMEAVVSFVMTVQGWKLGGIF